MLLAMFTRQALVIILSQINPVHLFTPPIP